MYCCSRSFTSELPDNLIYCNSTNSFLIWKSLELPCFSFRLSLKDFRVLVGSQFKWPCSFKPPEEATHSKRNVEIWFSFPKLIMNLFCNDKAFELWRYKKSLPFGVQNFLNFLNFPLYRNISAKSFSVFLFSCRHITSK